MHYSDDALLTFVGSQFMVQKRAKRVTHTPRSLNHRSLVHVPRQLQSKEQ
jgi:hypothetical protein